MSSYNTYYKYIKYKTKYLSLKGGQQYTITVKQPWFDFIKQGKKTVEGRLNRGLFARLKVGDKITWIHKNLKYQVNVVYIKKYDSFKQLLEEETIEKVLPNMSDINKGLEKVYHRYYTPEDEKQNGVVAIGMGASDNQTGGIDVNFSVHNGKLKDPHFNNILEGKKLYELRVNDEKRQKMHDGDIWIFSHNDKSDVEPFATTIVEVTKYKSFEEALEDKDVPFTKVIPDADTITDALKVYEGIDGYIDGAKKFGVVRFKLQVNNTHILKISNPQDAPTFDWIKHGIKTVEGRKYAEKYENYKPGDLLIFINNDNDNDNDNDNNNDTNEKIFTVIKELRKYKTLEEYLKIEGYDKVLPGIKSFDDALKVYNRWSSVEEREEAMRKNKFGFGFVAIEFIMIKN